MIRIPVFRFYQNLRNQLVSTNTDIECRKSLTPSPVFQMSSITKSSQQSYTTEHTGTNEQDFQNVFSTENRNRTVMSLLELKNLESPVKPLTTRKAAVLIPLCRDINGEPCLLYTLRSLALSNHRGEISFPGGVVDPTDTDVTATALRETEEELSIAKDQIDVWTVLGEIPTVSTLMGVNPILGFIKDPVDTNLLTVNPAEVEKAFTITLKHLCDKGNWGHTQLLRGYPIPVYKNMNVFHPDAYVKPQELSSSDSELEDSVPRLPKDVRLWGLTAIITHVVLTALLPNVYKRNLVVKKSSNPPS